MTNEKDPRAKLKNFIQKYAIEMDYEPSETNPYILEENEWSKNAYHYKIFFSRPGKKLTVYYSMGKFCERNPQIEEVLISLWREHETLESEKTFESWAKFLGYSEDSIKAYRSWESCKKLSRKFAKFIGELMEELNQCEPGEFYE